MSQAQTTWASFAPVKAAQQFDGSTFERNGHEWYTIVIGGQFINPIYFQPQGIKKDDRGEPVPSKWQNSNPYQTIALNPEGGLKPTVNQSLVHNWKSTSSDLQSLASNERSAVNAIKKWINNTESAVWYHNANADMCSQFGGPHLHVVIHSAKRGDGSYPVLQYNPDYKKIGQSLAKCWDNSGSDHCYIKSQRVKYLANLVKYLGTPPRVFLGTRSIELGKLRRALSCRPDEGDGQESMDGLFDDIQDDGDTQNENKPCSDDFGEPSNRSSRRENEDDFGGDLAEICSKYAPVVKKQRTDNYASTSFESDARSIANMQTKEDRFIRVIEQIMQHLQAYDFESLVFEIGKLNPSNEQNRNIKAVWQKLVTKTSTQNQIMRVRDKLKSETQLSPLKKLAETFLCSERALSDEYLTIDQSLNLFSDWCDHNGIDFDEICCDVRNIMDRTLNKVNTLLIIGPSNAGKTIMFKNTLMPLCPFNAQVGSVGNSGQFLWQMCPGTRAIFIEEARMAPEHIELAKAIFGGEECMVDVKMKPQSRLSRTPVIISSNCYPWLQAPSSTDKQALMNRMKIHHCSTMSDLAKVDKPLHPGMWWNICEALDEALEAAKTCYTSMYEDGKQVDVAMSITVDDCLRQKLDPVTVFDCSDID